MNLEDNKLTLIVTVIVVLVTVAALISSAVYGTTGAFKLYLPRLPDLQVLDASISDDQATITTTIINVGSEKQRVFEVALYERKADSSDSWDLIATRYVPLGLKQGQTAVVTFNWKQKVGGSRELRIVADNKDQIKELDEDNNELRFTAPAQALNPDLSVASIYIWELVVGKQTTIEANIYNSGSEVNEPFNVAIYDGSTFLGTVRVPNIGANDYKTVKVSWKPNEPGDHAIRVLVDVDREIPESDNENNYYTEVVTVL